MYFSSQYKNYKRRKLLYTVSKIAGFVGEILLLPLSLALPVSISFENGPIEKFQVVMLVATSIYNLTLMKASADTNAKFFHIWCAMLSFFLAVRELSWGRVFYQTGMNDEGPIFVTMNNYVWKTEAYTFMIAYILILLIILVKKLPVRRMLKCSPPWSILFIIIVSVILQYTGEHGYIIGKSCGQILEELSETIVYGMIPALCLYYHEALKKQ